MLCTLQSFVCWIPIGSSVRLLFLLLAPLRLSARRLSLVVLAELAAKPGPSSVLPPVAVRGARARSRPRRRKAPLPRLALSRPCGDGPVLRSHVGWLRLRMFLRSFYRLRRLHVSAVVVRAGCGVRWPLLLFLLLLFLLLRRWLLQAVATGTGTASAADRGVLVGWRGTASAHTATAVAQLCSRFSLWLQVGPFLSRGHAALSSRRSLPPLEASPGGAHILSLRLQLRAGHGDGIGVRSRRQGLGKRRLHFGRVGARCDLHKVERP